MVVPEPAPAEVHPTCTGNWDQEAFPDIVCGGEHGLNQPIANSDTVEGRSPYCCCYCDGHVDIPLAYCIMSEDVSTSAQSATDCDVWVLSDRNSLPLLAMSVSIVDRLLVVTGRWSVFSLFFSDFQ